MRLFWEITRRAYRCYLTYRAAIFAGLITNFFFGILREAIVLALYGEQQEVAGMTQQQAVTYTIVLDCCTPPDTLLRSRFSLL